MHEGAGSILNRSNLGLCGTPGGARWGKGAMVLISGFYVRYHPQIALPHFWRAGRRAFWPSPAAWTRQRKAPLRGGSASTAGGAYIVKLLRALERGDFLVTLIVQCNT